MAATRHFARNTLLRTILELAETVGVRRQDVLSEINVDEALVQDPNGVVPAEALIDAVEFVALRSGRNDIGLLLADRHDHRVLGAIGLLLEQTRSLPELNAAAGRFMHLHNTALDYKLVRERGRAFARLNIRAEPRHPPRHYVEAILGSVLRLFRLVLGGPYQPVAVHFRHEQLGPAAGYRLRFGAPVKFGQAHNEIVMRADDVGRVRRARDPEFKRMIESLVRDLDRNARRNLPARVARLVRMTLPAGEASVKHVAAMLQMPARTLQRKLAERGTSFARIVANVRAEMAREYLRAGGNTIVELAPLLGFSEASAVSRFVRRHMGVSARALKAKGRRAAKRGRRGRAGEGEETPAP